MPEQDWPEIIPPETVITVNGQMYREYDRLPESMTTAKREVFEAEAAKLRERAAKRAELQAAREKEQAEQDRLRELYDNLRADLYKLRYNTGGTRRLSQKQINQKLTTLHDKYVTAETKLTDVTFTQICRDYWRIVKCGECDLWVTQYILLRTGDAVPPVVCTVCQREQMDRGDWHWQVCRWCEQFFDDRLPQDHERSISVLQDRWVCFGDRIRNYRFCDQCNDWFRGTHVHPCACVPLHPHFTFRNGVTTVADGERFSVEMPKGYVTAVGQAAIGRYLENKGVYCGIDWDQIGAEWTTNRGTMPKRISSFVAKYNKEFGYEYRLTSDMLADIGMIAKDNTAKESMFHLQMSRDLNQSAAYWFHTASCWFGTSDQGRARCAFKSSGGFGLRSFKSATSDEVVGRVWVQPLNNRLQPTHQSLDCYGYVVFNNYGNLDGYSTARVIAQMTGMSYKKVSYRCEMHYVNNSSGYLIAPPDVCARVHEVRIPKLDIHDTFDGKTFQPPEQEQLQIDEPVKEQVNEHVVVA